MAISNPQVIKEEEEEDYNEDGESGTEDSSEYGEDSIYEIRENAHSDHSKISVKKSKSQIFIELDSESEEDLDISEVKVPKLDKNDERCFEKVQKIIQAGQLDKLKVDECKVYLRKYGLRLTGKKDVVIGRIREHLEFSIVSRSATAPPCGTRIVAGRIVKESYGAAKQQHTFTIEVLWSRGEKPLPPLHPLLIKGRNLYKLKTMRQRWANEDERKKVLLQKHSRGNIARRSRETRIQQKEMRNMASNKRIKRKEISSIPQQSDQHQQNAILFSEFRQPSIQQQQQQYPNISTGILPNPFVQQNLVTITTGQRSSAPQFPVHVNGRFPINGRQSNPIQCFGIWHPNIQEQEQHTNMPMYFHQPTTHLIPRQLHNGFPADSQQHFHAKNHQSTVDVFPRRQPLTSLNNSFPQMHPMWRQLCPFYQQGRSHY